MALTLCFAMPSSLTFHASGSASSTSQTLAVSLALTNHTANTRPTTHTGIAYTQS